MDAFSPAAIREWADRAEKMRGFGVGAGEPARIVVEALRLYADKVEREAKERPAVTLPAGRSR